MVDLDVLKACGVDAESWKAKLSQPRAKRTDKQNALLDRIRRRMQAGRDMNIEHHLVYKALDDAWDISLKQLSPTLLRTLMDKDRDMADVVEILKTWDMDPSEVIQEVPDPKTPGKNIKKVSLPAFFRIYVPLCCAYVKIRWANMTNDRMDDPFFKFDPSISDLKSRVKCDVITARVEEMVRQYGYFDVFKQAIFRMLHYAECLQFPVEEWHTESQLLAEDSPYEGEEVEVGGKKFKKVIVKEGMRYHLPHPTRTYYDRAWFASTLNSDSGCSFAGYWRVVRWRDVMDNPSFYNLDSVGYQEFADWFKGKANNTYWTNTLKGCALNFPGLNDGNSQSKYDNEASLTRWYSADMADAPCVISEHFEKIIPKDHDLGDYEYPIWGRFVLAADSNMIYSAPLPYHGPIWYGYDWAEGRTHNASMTLECLPFQDAFSNLLTQTLLTTKQNLANLAFVNTDLVDEDQIKKIENLGERWYRPLNFIRTSFDKIRKSLANRQMTQADVIASFKPAFQDTTQLYQAMKTILDTLERVLVMSAQEIGQAASHEQTREEVRHIAANTSTRVTFTNQGVTAAWEAWKKQIYAGLMAYGSKEFYAQVPLETTVTSEQLEKMGFTFKDDSIPTSQGFAHIKGDKSALMYESFASDRDGDDRVDDVESAKGMLSEFSQLLANPMLSAAIGADQSMKIINYINRFLGFPRDFILVNTGQNSPDQLQQMKQYVDQSIQKEGQQVMQTITEDVKQAIQQMAQKNQQQDSELQQVQQGMQKMGQIIQMASQHPIQPPSPSILDFPNGMPQVAPPGM